MSQEKINNPKWQKCKCEVCSSSFVIHDDWVNPPKLCKYCQLKNSDLLEAIDTILNTQFFDPSEYELKKLSDLVATWTDPSQINLYMWKQVKILLSEIGLENEIDSFFVGINIDTIDHLINKIIKKNLTKSSESYINWILYEIYDVLGNSGKYQKKIINNNLAREISYETELFKIIKRAIKFNEQLSKRAEDKIKKQNERRTSLNIDGKRRWTG